MKTLLVISVFAIIFSLGIISVQDAHATLYDSINDCNALGGLLSGTICGIGGGFTFYPGDTLTIPSGTTLELTFYGIINSGGIINNYGTITISNYLYNGIINNGGIINNYGTITVSNNDGIGIKNYNGGTITNNSVGQITVSNTGGYGITNTDTIYNYGTITISNTGGYGIYNQSGTINNSATITVQNTAGTGILNGGTIKISKGGSITNSGTILNCGKIIGKIKNSGTGTVTKTCTY
jgi:hypothetical protein